MKKYSRDKCFPNVDTFQKNMVFLAKLVASPAFTPSW